MSEKNDYDVLENQIGNMGSESQEENDAVSVKPPKSLGKIQHKEILGEMSELSDSEKESLEAFKKRGNDMRSARKEATVMNGWIPINKDSLGERSKFYPESFEFYVRPATVGAIKNWTAVDETDSVDVNNVLNEILKTSVKVVDTSLPESSQSLGWGRINSWDRFWFIMKVREATFYKGESRVEFQDACSECGEEITYELTSDSLFFELPDEDIVEKHWNGKEWEIDPSEYDVVHEPIKLYTPTCQKDDAIIRWAQATTQARKKIDEKFIKFLVWMMKAPLKDSLLDDQIQKLYKEYKNWDAEFYNFMDDVVRNLTVNPSENLAITCPSCGRRSVSTVQFPNGIKKLFAAQTKAKKFGSR